MRLKQFCNQRAERAFRRPFSDQHKRLFDDAQFEAYRALGAHVAEEAIRQAKLDVPIGGRKGLTLQDLAERYYV